jgi:hypothetical protein
VDEFSGLELNSLEEDLPNAIFQDCINSVFDSPPIAISVKEKEGLVNTVSYTLFMDNADILHILSYREGDVIYRTVDINGDSVYKEETDTIHYNKEFASEVYSLYLQYLEEHGV